MTTTSFVGDCDHVHVNVDANLFENASVVEIAVEIRGRGRKCEFATLQPNRVDARRAGLRPARGVDNSAGLPARGRG